MLASDPNLQRQLNADTFSVSPDQRYVVLRSDRTPAETARYSIYELSNRNIFPLTHRVRTQQSLAAPLLQHVLWSPCCRHSRRRPIRVAADELQSSFFSITTNSTPKISSNSSESQADYDDEQSSVDDWQAIAFVHENDIYYKAHVQDDLVIRLTSSGQDGLVYNGRPDWLYENTEELRGDALAFAPDGRYLAFMEFNDTVVETYE